MFNKIKSILGEQCWGIGFTSPISLDTTHHRSPKIKWIKGTPRDRWYADPFIVKDDKNNITILAEEYRYKAKIGTIAELTINKKTNRITAIRDVLNLSTHLSFPLLFKDNTNVYICPENYQSGRWTAYKYDIDNGIIGEPIILINKPLVDASCATIDKKYYVFGTMFSENFSEGARELYIYEANNFEGPYELFQTIKLDKAIARGAGAIIFHQDRMIIPTQNCEGRYGQEVVFSDLYLSNGEFHLAEITRLTPKKFSRFRAGIHTYNQFQNIAVVDGVKYRYGIIANLLSSLYKMFIKC